MSIRFICMVTEAKSWFIWLTTAEIVLICEVRVSNRISMETSDAAKQDNPCLDAVVQAIPQLVLDIDLAEYDRRGLVRGAQKLLFSYSRFTLGMTWFAGESWFRLLR